MKRVTKHVLRSKGNHILAATCILFFLSTISMGQGSFSFTTIDFPGSNFTQVWDINNAGEIVGVYAIGGRHFGFLLSGGIFTTIDPPGASYSEALGINDGGQIVGWFNDAGNARHYFLFSGGTYSPFDSQSPFSSGKVSDINNLGQMVGEHSSNGANLNGFLFSGGSFTPVNFPGASNTIPTRIDDLGRIVGHYGSNSGSNGFLLELGNFTSVAFPGATSTAADGINNLGRIVGAYVIGGTFHGYLLSDDTFTTVDFPGSANTEILGINDSGVIVGEYWGSSGFSPHGFLAVPAIAPAGSVIVQESCPPVNGAIDPGETDSVSLTLVNNTGSTSNLVATLQPTNNVLSPSGPQSYGTLASTQSVSRNFAFTANGNCGEVITLTLQLQDGATNLGTVSFNFTLGCNTACAGTPRVSTSSVLTCDGSNTVATITISNTGTAIANNVMLTTAKLGALNGAPLPIPVGALAPGNSVVRLVTFNGAPSGLQNLLIAGTHAGGGFSSTRKLNAPNCGVARTEPSIPHEWSAAVAILVSRWIR